MNIVIANQQVTMSSLEMVEYINTSRKDGEAVLQHKHFLDKVPQVLGEGSAEFSATYVHPQNKQTYPCYNFPKREACLMAMSYSYELQAKVFDRMTELEQKQLSPTEILVQQAQRLLDQERRHAALENQVAMIASKIQAQQDFFTIIGYANTLDQKLKLDTMLAAVLGRRASTLSKQRDIMVGKTNDPRFGQVNTYHESVLEDVFLEFKGVRIQ